MRVRVAWQLIFSDYGFFQKHNVLINMRRKIAIELQNGEEEDHELLKTFKIIHPDYEVIIGFINYHTPREIVKDGVKYLYGNKLLEYIFKGSQNAILKQMRAAVTYISDT